MKKEVICFCPKIDCEAENRLMVMDITDFSKSGEEWPTCSICDHPLFRTLVFKPSMLEAAKALVVKAITGSARRPYDVGEKVWSGAGKSEVWLVSGKCDSCGKVRYLYHDSTTCEQCAHDVEWTPNIHGDPTGGPY